MKITMAPTFLAATMLASAPAQAQASECPNPETAPAEIEKTIDDFFAALRMKDSTQFKTLVTDRFYAFDVGERFEGDALAVVIREALADGVEINWTLGPKDTTVRCNVAWSQWENVGSAGKPPEVRPLRWLESAVFVHEDGRWKLDFFHSQRAKSE